MLSTLNETKIKTELAKEQYEAMIKQYRNEIKEYGNKTFIEYINNIFDTEKIIDELFTTLESNLSSHVINFTIFDQTYEIHLFDLISKYYVNNQNSFKYVLTKTKPDYKFNKSDPTDMKLDKIKEYCCRKGIRFNENYLFGKDYNNQYCLFHHNCYYKCVDCRLEVIKENNTISRTYKNNKSIYNNVNFSVDIRTYYENIRAITRKKIIEINIVCNFTNLYKITKIHDEIIKLLPVIRMKYDRIINSSNKPDDINQYLQQINKINESIPLIKDNKLYITDIEHILNTVLQLDKKLDHMLSPLRGFFSMLFKKKKAQLKQTKPPEYDTISIRTNPPPYDYSV